MRVDFVGHEPEECKLLLKVHEELYVVKKKLDDRGKLFDAFQDDKEVKIEAIKYELLKRIPDQKQACYKQGEKSIKITYEHSRHQNPDDLDLIDAYEKFAVAINTLQFGDDIDKALSQLKLAEVAQAKIEADKTIQPEKKEAFDGFVQQILPFSEEIKSKVAKRDKANKQRMMRNLSIGAMVLGAAAFGLVMFN